MSYVLFSLTVYYTRLTQLSIVHFSSHLTLFFINTQDYYTTKRSALLFSFNCLYILFNAQDYFKDENGKIIQLKHCTVKPLGGGPMRAPPSTNTVVSPLSGLTHVLSKSVPAIQQSLVAGIRANICVYYMYVYLYYMYLYVYYW